MATYQHSKVQTTYVFYSNKVKFIIVYPLSYLMKRNFVFLHGTIMQLQTLSKYTTAMQLIVPNFYCAIHHFMIV